MVTARRTADLLRRAPLRAPCTSSAWGERVRVGPLSSRLPGAALGRAGAQRYYRGYNGYTIESGTHRVLFGGDTAMTTSFRALEDIAAV